MSSPDYWKKAEEVERTLGDIILARGFGGASLSFDLVDEKAGFCTFIVEPEKELTTGDTEELREWVPDNGGLGLGYEHYEPTEYKDFHLYKFSGHL